MAARVFISYRRDESKYQAKAIYEAFVGALSSEYVFMDVASINPGAEFEVVLETWIKRSEIMLALIGPNWANAIDPRTGRRRLENRSDFMRAEIRAALKHGVLVVPVLLDGAELPTSNMLPNDIKPIVGRQAEFVEFRTFSIDVQRMIKRLGIAQAVGRATTTQSAKTSVPDDKTFFEVLKRSMDNEVLTAPISTKISKKEFIAAVEKVTKSISTGQLVDEKIRHEIGKIEMIFQYIKSGYRRRTGAGRPELFVHNGQFYVPDTGISDGGSQLDVFRQEAREAIRLFNALCEKSGIEGVSLNAG